LRDRGRACPRQLFQPVPRLPSRACRALTRWRMYCVFPANIKRLRRFLRSKHPRKNIGHRPGHSRLSPGPQTHGSAARDTTRPIRGPLRSFALKKLYIRGTAPRVATPQSTPRNAKNRKWAWLRTGSGAKISDVVQPRNFNTVAPGLRRTPGHHATPQGPFAPPRNTSR
jgi:hypothetical protein